MNIIIDITRVFRRSIKGKMLTGIDRVAMAYVHHYRHTGQALVRWCGRSWVLSHAASKALFAWLESPTSKFAAMLIIVRGILSFSPPKSEANTFLVNTGHIGLGQSDYLRMMRKWKVKPIFFVHDLIAITYPEFCDPGEDTRHREKMNYILRIASGVITNSEATLQDLIQYSQLTDKPMPRAKVALLASGITAKAPGKRPIEKPYFVILSTIEPRKNHLLLLQIWRSLSQRLGDKTPHLFLIGGRGWECENVVDMLERCQFLKGVVTEIAHCPDTDLINYIHHSQALLTPSFIEGYGLPLIEALTLGVPVIASDLPVFREIAGDVPEYVDSLDGMRWAELILEYTQPDSVRRADQIRRIKEFKKPTWEEHFSKVDAFLTEFASASGVSAKNSTIEIDLLPVK